MWNFQDTFETRKRLFISAFSFCMAVPVIADVPNYEDKYYSSSKVDNIPK